MQQLYEHSFPEPHVFPAVNELTDLMESGKAWTLGHVHTAMKEVLSCLNDLVEIFPISLIRLCLDIETRCQFHQHFRNSFWANIFMMILKVHSS